MERKVRFSCLLVILFSLPALLICCSGGAKDYLATPEDTIKTYNRQASNMHAMIDTLSYSKAIECFSKPAQGWFAANANSLVKNPDELDGYSGSRREAYVFIRYIVPNGPKTSFGEPAIEKISESGKEAKYKVNGFEVTLIKDGNNWRFKSMFGMEGG